MAMCSFVLSCRVHRWAVWKQDLEMFLGKCESVSGLSGLAWQCVAPVIRRPQWGTWQPMHRTEPEKKQARLALPGPLKKSLGMPARELQGNSATVAEFSIQNPECPVPPLAFPWCYMHSKLPDTQLIEYSTDLGGIL